MLSARGAKSTLASGLTTAAGSEEGAGEGGAEVVILAGILEAEIHLDFVGRPLVPHLRQASGVDIVVRMDRLVGQLRQVGGPHVVLRRDGSDSSGAWWKK